ncbi:di-heme oxidoredictase family protein [Bradyrhizobium sp. YR681]|uniref:di-heme oxidoredictase family protein n=1 Tax=Bradyrhizobium sp. YR681 TaxID=1144344 RepID=UPI0012F69A99|nr:di-heme oxidoredictase family protein [Bradyrhizobium sp. YR681]
MSEQALVPTALGETVQRRAPEGHVAEVGPDGVVTRRTPPLFGIGLLEYSRRNNSQKIFGAFAEIDSLEKFVARAFAIELGISSELSCSRSAQNQDYPKSCTPILSRRELEDVVTFVRFLAAPPNRNQTSAIGSKLFSQIGCSSCHVEYRVTSAEAPPALRNKRFAPFTDLQLHDLGGSTARLRTAPLWGLNSYGPPYLHDGSGNSIEDAIAHHGGEAKPARHNFSLLEESDKIELIAFLKSL